MPHEARLEITDGELRLPVTGMDRRLFSRENLSRTIKGLSRTVGGNVISDNGKTYVHCLKNININLASGDRLGLIGHNGSGKTTLLKVLAGIYPLSHGTVRVQGDISTFISQGVGMNLEMTAVNYLEMQCMIRNYSKNKPCVSLKKC